MQSLLKMMNSVIGMVGIAMIIYSLWLIRVWERQMGHFPSTEDHQVPWFIFIYISVCIFNFNVRLFFVVCHSVLCYVGSI